MSYNKDELLSLPLDERKELASSLIDSILADEATPLPAWKSELIKERLKQHKQSGGIGINWNDLKKKYGR